MLSFPDRPYLIWSYRNGTGQSIRRNNQKDFLVAADMMCQTMQRWIAGNADAQVSGLPAADKKKIANLFKSTKHEDGHKRHEVWMKKIQSGHFSFGAANPVYIPKGKGSWKHKAIGTMEWTDDPHDKPFAYKESFLTSDWKMFHDALQAHRYDVIHDILPKYGICAA